MNRFIPAVDLSSTFFRDLTGRNLQNSTDDGTITFNKFYALTWTIVRCGTGNSPARRSDEVQVTMSASVALHGLYCVEPPTPRTRTV
jgi:hypothetical protein